MTTTTLAAMVVICATIWGGLVLLIVHAVRSENRRNREALEESGS